MKNIQTTKYPFTNKGSTKFDIAGEHIEQSGKNQILSSNSFEIDYITEIPNKNNLLDTIFYLRPNADQITKLEQYPNENLKIQVYSSKPDISNTLTTVIIASIILFPLIILLPITIPLSIWIIKVQSYSIEPHRIITKSGILFKKQITILFNKIDHISNEQKILNKLFKNGTININTVGSSKTEMILNNIPDYKEFYEILTKQKQ